jgi:3-methyl-2-oxobutanoate hydroxymethyltransferase
MHALESAGKMMKEGAFEAVKLEGGNRYAEHVSAIVGAGIPVVGHLGLLPQSVHAMGGFRVQGREEGSADQLLADARALEQAGAYAIVLEGIPAEVARRVTEGVGIPTIGIGAGPHCDGQVLVSYDFLGMYSDVRPKFVRRFAELGEAVVQATQGYVAAVQQNTFPAAEHSFAVAPSKAKAAALDTGARPVVEEAKASYGPASDDVS